MAGIALAMVAIWTLVRLWFAGAVELLPEEAYYWTYTAHPALSYFDHPPMVAWFIAAGTALLGHTELGVRAGTIALSLGSTWLLFLLTRRWFDVRAGWVAVLLFNLLPVFMGLGVLAFPDGPLIFFWLLTLYAVSRGLDARRYWLLAGAALGGAMLSKYTAVLLVPSVVLFLLVSPAQRHWLRRAQPWIALLIAGAMFSIVVAWNAQHHWASFLFQSGRTADESARWWQTAPMFWLYQLIALTPAGLALAGWTLANWRREERWNFVVALALPLFLVFVAASFKTEVHINWTAPAFLSVIVGAAALLAGKLERPRWRAGMVAAAAFSVVACGVVMSSVRWGVPEIFAYSAAGGWRALAEAVEDAEHELERATGQEPFILGMDKYNLAAELSFYTREPQEQLNVFAVGLPGLGFAYWTKLEDWEGHPAIAVLPRLRPGLMAELNAHFERLEEPRLLEVPSIGHRSRRVYLINCHGYHSKHREDLLSVERKL